MRPSITFLVNNEKVTSKKIYIRLQPANPKMKSIILHNQKQAGVRP